MTVYHLWYRNLNVLITACRSEHFLSVKGVYMKLYNIILSCYCCISLMLACIGHGDVWLHLYLSFALHLAHTGCSEGSKDHSLLITHTHTFLSLRECWLITAVPQLSKWCFLSCLILVGPCTLHERFSRLAILFCSARQAAVVKIV